MRILFSSASQGLISACLGRILRYLASFGCVKEVAQDTFTKSNISETFAVPGFRSGIYHKYAFFRLVIRHLQLILA